MREIMLIAWREYRQYIFSRGFLLFLVLFPAGLFVGSFAVLIAERAQPTRYFTVYDESGAGYTQSIIDRIDHAWLHTALAAWDAWVKTSLESDDADALPGPFAPGDVNDQRIEAFLAAGGFDAARAAAAGKAREGAPAYVEPKAAYEFVAPPDAVRLAPSLAAAQDALRPYLLDEQKAQGPDGEPRTLFAAILIPAGFDGLDEDAPEAEYWSRNLTDSALQGHVRTALRNALKRHRYAELGIEKATVERVESIDASIAAFRPDRETENAKLNMRDAIETGLPAVMTYILLIIIFAIGNLLLTNTIEERSNKIVEILLSSVTANQLMLGKLIGIAAVGLTMPTIMLAGGIGVATTFSNEAGGENIASLVLEILLTSNLIPIYFFYFICAYLIFAMIFLAIGSISNSLQDAQSFMGPVMLIVFAPLPFMVLIFQNPNGLAATILTWIPIYTPYAVLMRAASDPPLWEIVGATALMLVFAAVLMSVMGRIFRSAILQASPPKLADLLKYARKGAA